VRLPTHAKKAAQHGETVRYPLAMTSLDGSLIFGMLTCLQKVEATMGTHKRSFDPDEAAMIVLRREIEAARAEVNQLRARPSVFYRPELTVDDNQWMALYGDNPQDGVAGFGDSPAEAMSDFDRVWVEKLRR
jgi:hypothetical protein